MAREDITGARDGHVQAVVSQGPYAEGLRQLESFSLALNLEMTVHGLRDQFRALLGRSPH